MLNHSRQGVLSVKVVSHFCFLMEQIPSCDHPIPGWVDADVDYQGGTSSIVHTSTEVIGKHCILELYDCDKNKLNDEAFVRTSITIASKVAGAKLLNLITHRFDPQGVTGLALLAESHISIHTWPENGYAAVDVFTCGNHTVPDRACDVLRTEFGAQSHELKSFSREAPTGLRGQLRNPFESATSFF